ncbi:hypothetical protein Ngar_c09930 [Candidatus Nitrososphaera gargensis Ga9.2]|uniref:Uncharacterized protein n=2 Tax=Candidatus Nitrososphaera gargensis TaxID=497727 RepID=K0IDW3_NITGG|nr:hypothetical protein Ngar_c09930 [Candidatus Nitrososphaera gargensis Ga9.2]
MVEESFVRILTVVALFSVGTVSAITTATKESRIAAAPATVHRYGTLAETKWHEVMIDDYYRIESALLHVKENGFAFS